MPAARQEIERKFLVANETWRSQAHESFSVVQGYLVSTPERTVRVRLAGSKGALTIKGGRSASGLSRFEWEIELPRDDAERMLGFCEPGRIEKTRYLVRVGAHTFEVDEFHGDNAGLTVAEVELRAEDEQFERPGWLGAEVTADERYQNAMLVRRPYSIW